VTCPKRHSHTVASMRLGASRLVTVGLALVLLASACGPDQRDEPVLGHLAGKDAEVGAAQVAAMDDGIADLAEYRAAVLRFVACMEDAGFTVDALHFRRDSQLYDHRISDEAVEAGADLGCYERELGAIDRSWRESPARPTGGGELRSIAVLLARCLELHGIDHGMAVTERSDPAPLEQLVADHGLALDDCASEVAAGL
jgi:hypothetical protein